MTANKCPHVKRKPYYEDDILMGSLFWGYRCVKCGDIKAPEPGPLELGTYSMRDDVVWIR